VGGNPTPTELAAACDEDLAFAAHVMRQKERRAGGTQRGRAGGTGGS
jgi:hypothetical protein